MNINRLAAWSASAAMLVTALVGLWLAGAPSAERERRVDEQRIAALQQVARVVSMYFSASGTLPPDIDALVDGRNLMALPRDPVSGAVYDYLPSGAASYQLCATFEAASSGDPPDSFWAHEAGYVCFRLNPGYGNN